MNYKELKEFLIKCSDSYYKESKSLISDYEFDMKLKELERLESEQGFRDPDSPTIKPGSDLNSSLSKKHTRPMLSLENAYSMDEIFEWTEKMSKFTKDLRFSVESKIDGSSASITFKNGKIIKALTRGTGEIGEDITENIKLLNWDSISKDFSGEVRGEIVITKAGFEALNRNGQYQNARNLVSGSMKLLDRDEFKLRAPYIKFIAYWNESLPYSSHIKNINALKDNGFVIVDPLIECSSNEDLEKAISKIDSMKENLEYEIDGAVIKLDNVSLWNEIGSTSKFPRWAKAFKYKQEEVETTVTKITYEVGRTGKITPLCFFKPVFIDGSTIEKATLNNKDFMESMNINVGSKILVRKAACIIPQIVRVIEKNGDLKEEFPVTCPVCGSKLEKKNINHADYFCTNPNCSARVCDKIMNFTHLMKINGFAEIVIEKLFNEGVLKSISDLYSLKEHKNEIVNLEKFGEKTFNNLINEIEQSKKRPLELLIPALGIPNVGPKLGKELAKHFKSLDNFIKASREELLGIEDVGEIVADSINDYFENESNIELINTLRDNNVNFNSEFQEVKSSSLNSINGKTLCITGTLSKPRNEIIKDIEKFGGKVSGISKNTFILVCNETNSTSTKMKTAKSLGIKIITEEELYKDYLA